MLIRTEAEYQGSLQEIKKWEESIAFMEADLKKKDYTDENIRHTLAGHQNFLEHMREDVKQFECCKEGNIDPVNHMDDFGRALVGARIASGLTQAEFARLLGISEEEAACNEMNEYHGAKTNDIARVLELLGVEIHCTFSVKKTEGMPKAGE